MTSSKHKKFLRWKKRLRKIHYCDANPDSTESITDSYKSQDSMDDVDGADGMDDVDDLNYLDNIIDNIVDDVQESESISVSSKSDTLSDSGELPLSKSLTGTITPKKLAIYFGVPSKVNGSTTIQQAVDIFKQYDLVVFGPGLEEPSHPDHSKTEQIINDPDMANTQVFGFIDSTQDVPPLKTCINKLDNMGMYGVYLDSFGFGPTVDREKQNHLIDYTHDKSMVAMCSTQNIDQVFDDSIDPIYNPLGVASTISNIDWYLYQGYQIVNGSYQNTTDWLNISQKISDYQAVFGTCVATITTYDNSVYDQNKADYSYYSTILWNFDSWGWGEQNFSYSSNLLPFRGRKEIKGTKFITTIEEDLGVYQRYVNIGINVDTVNHVVSNLTH